MGREHQVIRFIEERIQPGAGGSPLRMFHPRVHSKVAVTYDDVAAIIRSDAAVHNYIADTNWFTAHEVPLTVWDALAAKRLVVTAGVWNELKPWRERPFHNEKMVDTLAAARTSRDRSIVFDDLDSIGAPHSIFLGYYVNVLAQRKRKAVELVETFVLENQRQPSDAELNRLFQRGFNERDLQIFRKGYEEITSGGQVFTDEEIVAHAATVAFGLDANVTILTRDHDVFEQFFKLTGLLTVAYQANLFAERFAAEPSSFQTIAMPENPETNAYFVVDESRLVKKPVSPDDFVEWLMPKEWTPAIMRCLLFTGRPPDLTLTELTFVGEREMRSLIEAKGTTWGLNSNQLNGRNCHVTGFPWTIPNPRESVIVSSDRVITAPGQNFRFSKFELAHAVLHFEEMTTG